MIIRDYYVEKGKDHDTSVRSLYKLYQWSQDSSYIGIDMYIWHQGKLKCSLGYVSLFLKENEFWILFSKFTIDNKTTELHVTT